MPAVATTLQNASNAAPLVSSETSQIETDRTQSSESTKESAKLAANLSVAGESLPRGENNNDPSNNFINNNAQAGEADGADSGIGSDSPKAAKENHLTLREKEETNYTADVKYNFCGFTRFFQFPFTIFILKRGVKGVDNFIELRSFQQQPIVKTPPEVPPKPVNSSEIMNGRRGSLTNYENEEFLDPDDPLRASLEDSTIGRDHSVLPPGARQQTKRNDATTGGSGSESDKPPLAKPSPATHNFEHNLVVKGRLANSNLFEFHHRYFFIFADHR